LYDGFDNERVFAAASPEFEFKCFCDALREGSGLQGLLFINLSPRAFLNYHRALISLDVGTRKVVIELTENHFVDSDILRDPLKLVRTKYFVCLDDFGRGPTLGLLDLVPDFLKIDKELVRNCDRSEFKKSLLREFATWPDRGIKTIAEGVQTQSEYDACLEAGIQYFQGFYLAQPRTCAERREFTRQAICIKNM